MSRPLSERVQDWRWWAEQAAHMALGAVAAGIYAVGQPIVAGLAAALWLALVREWDQRPVESWGDATVDVAATALGGIGIGLLIWAVA